MVPDFLIRIAIRLLLRQRLRDIDHGSFEADHAAKMRWIEEVRERERIADLPEKANEQHYEVGGVDCLRKYLFHTLLGSYGLHDVLFGTVREVLLLPVPYGE